MSSQLAHTAESGGLYLTTGVAAHWQAAGDPAFTRDVPHAFATRQIIAAPTASELPGGPDEPPWRQMYDRALAILANGAQMVGCDSFELRLVATPQPEGPATVELFVTAMARQWDLTVALTAVEAACAQLPPGFEVIQPRGGPSLATDDTVRIDLRRREMVTYPTWDFVPADFYYTVSGDHGDGSGWAAFWRVLSAVTEPAVVSLLFARTELDPVERGVLGDVLTDLMRYAEPRTEYDFMGHPATYPACAEAGRTLRTWQDRLEQLDNPLLARLAVRAASTTAVTVATALASAVTRNVDAPGNQPMELTRHRQPSDVRQSEYSFDWMEIVPWGGHPLWQDERAPLSLRRLPYLYGLHEAAGLLALPVPDEQGVPGLARARRTTARRQTSSSAAGAGKGVLLGRRLHYGQAAGEVQLPLSALNRHALVVGSSGTGKTTAVMSLLTRLWQEHGIPFLVIESVKNEYRTLLGAPGMDDLTVVTLGNERVSPIRLNVLAPPPGVRAEKHQGAVLAALKLALPLFPPQPQILAKALARTYDLAGWDDDTTTSDGIAPPSLRDLLRCYQDVFEEIGYRGEALNIGLGFQARLESLLQGARGKLLDTVTSTDFAALLERPLVIEMNDVADPEDRAILAAMLLQRVRAAAEARGSSGGQLRHVTVIEEAHRLLGRSDGSTGDSASGDRARADSVQAFCEAIAELRSYGEGFVLSSQSPAKLADAAISGTSTRVVLKLESAADRRTMLDDIDANDGLRDTAARLRNGEALVRWSELDDSELVALSTAEGVDSGRLVSDEQVATAMSDQRAATGRLLPYPVCSPVVCPGGCTGSVRRTGQRLAHQLGRQAGERWRSSPTTAVAEIAGWLADAAAGDTRTAYCGAAQLAADGVALTDSPGIDRRSVLITAIREATQP